MTSLVSQKLSSDSVKAERGINTTHLDSDQQLAFVSNRQADGCVAFSSGLFKIRIGASGVCSYCVGMVLDIINSYSLVQCLFLLRGHGAGHYQQLQLSAVSVLIAWAWCWTLSTVTASVLIAWAWCWTLSTVTA